MRIDQLRGTIAAGGYESFGVDAEDGSEHPVLVVADFVELLAGRGLEHMDGVVGATEAILLSCQGLAMRRRGVIGQRGVVQQLACLRVPDLDLTEPGRCAPSGNQQAAIFAECNGENALGFALEALQQCAAIGFMQQHFTISGTTAIVWPSGEYRTAVMTGGCMYTIGPALLVSSGAQSFFAPSRIQARNKSTSSVFSAGWPSGIRGCMAPVT